MAVLALRNWFGQRLSLRVRDGARRVAMQHIDAAAEHRSSEARILAVDDIPANLIALCALLEPMGYQVVTADSGPRALACAAESEFALVLLDAMMPGMDGFETLQRLHQLPRFNRTPVLLVTAYDPQPDTLDHAYAMGAADYVVKPIAPNVLRAKVEVFMSLYKRGLELQRRGQALAAKDRQISILAHDLRSPLATIEMVAQSVARNDPWPNAHDQMERIVRAARRMDTMTRDLLDFARVGAGGLPITRREMDLAQAARETVEEIGAAHPDRNIELEITGDLRGNWDRERLQQGLANLVVNAIKYGRGPITVGVRRTESRVELTVWNEGDPIAEPRIGRIFEPFERGREGGSGLGLGLYIVREIARAHGGTVAVSSSIERGTIFTLALPTEIGEAQSPKHGA